MGPNLVFTTEAQRAQSGEVETKFSRGPTQTDADRLFGRPRVMHGARLAEQTPHSLREEVLTIHTPFAQHPEMPSKMLKGMVDFRLLPSPGKRRRKEQLFRDLGASAVKR